MPKCLPKRIHCLALAGTVLLALGGAARAEETQSFQSLFDSIARNRDCSRKELRDYTLFICPDAMTFWYFTTMSNPAYPGVVKRSFIRSAGTIRIEDKGTSY